MTVDEHKTLGLLLYRLAETFRARVTDATIRGYCRALDDLPLAAVRLALDRAEREAERFPAPFVLRRLTRPEGAARSDLPRLPAPAPPPPLSRAVRAAILRDVAERDARGEYSAGRGAGRCAWMRDLADALERGDQPKPTGNAFADTLARIAIRQPGGDDDDPTPVWWDR